VEVWQTSNLRRLRLGEEKKKKKKNKPQHEIYMVSLFHRATIKEPKMYKLERKPCFTLLLWPPYVIG